MFPSAAFELVKRFDELPDDAILPDKAACLVLGISERTLRYRIPEIPKIKISQGRGGRRVGDIRAHIRRGRA
jgi:hypothetical protein